jgi:hypothetical protein
MPEQEAPVRKRRRWWPWVLGSLVLGCCPLWIFANWAYERYEITRLDALVDDGRIPGYVAAKDARNDWPFGTSNGAYVRIHWLVVTNQAQALSDFVDGLSLPEGVEAGVYDLGVAPGSMERESTAVPYGQAHLFLLTVSTVRGPYQWEIPD